MTKTDIIAIPQCLKEFEKQLVALQREYIKIEAKPKKEELVQDPTKLTSSKFLGLPFVPATDSYPVSDDGKPMILIAQINFSEIPHLKGFPCSGLLQLYFPVSDWWDDGSSKIVYFSGEELSQSPITDFSFLADLDLDELPISKVHELSFQSSIDTGCSEDSQFSLSFGELDYWDFEESLNKDDTEKFDDYFSCDGHKIGGYADFTQGDPRDYDNSKKDDIQILQIDVDEFIMFGDGGLGHIFISPENLKTCNFEKAYFYWDCC